MQFHLRALKCKNVPQIFLSKRSGGKDIISRQIIKKGLNSDLKVPFTGSGPFPHLGSGSVGEETMERDKTSPI